MAQLTSADTFQRDAEPPSRLRIGLISEFVYPFHKGGAEKRFYELGRRLAARGHDVHWFAMRHWDGDPSIVFEGMRLHSAREPLDVYAPDGSRSIGAAMRLSLALTRALRRVPVQFDVIDCSLYPIFHIFGSKLVRREIPLVVTWHEYWGDHWYEYLGRRGLVGKHVERLAARVPQRIIAVSDMAREGLEQSGVESGRVSTIHNGVDTAGIESVAPSGTVFDIVFFGRLKNHKNVGLLLSAVARLKERRSGISCLVIGDGPERESLESLAVELGIARNVVFKGAVDDEEMLSLVKSSRVFVNPSTKEGGGSITLLEANAAGVPAIAIRHPMGIDEALIREGENGWWVEEADAWKLAAVIAHALESADSDALAARCRRFARRYDWDAVAERYERVYTDVVFRSRKAA